MTDNIIEENVIDKIQVKGKEYSFGIKYDSERNIINETYFRRDEMPQIEEVIRNAQTATSEAEKVDATITDANVLEVTGRDGVKKSLELASQADAATIKTELAKKFDKENVVQELGKAEDKVMSQKAVSDKISDLALGINTELISPSGNKFELSVQDDGTLKALPIIPSKGAFFGNSLLVGSGYDMAASDDRHDYYYLINSYIKGLNNSYVYNKYTSANFEDITSEDTIESAVNSVVNNLTGDETLVSIQLGDNVNTAEKNAVFPASSLALCKAVRAKCPNARVVWMCYSSDSKYQAIQNACKQTGCKFISYEGLKGSDANSKIGNIQKKSSAQRTISDVTNVVENSSSGSIKNITVTFTVSGSSYISTLDVSNYSLSGGTLTYTSEYEIITAGGVASHPGDECFRRISNRFLYEMKLTDDQEYYKKS